jgi:membrane associated rhomboid family serine protease
MNDSAHLCTYLIILGTCVFSYLGFKSSAVEEKYIFNPESILAWKEYYRLGTSGFLHSGWNHLILNMLSLYWFGGPIESEFGKANFLLVYFGAIIGGNLLSLYVHRHHDYRAYGASGGVCGLIFANILMFPGRSFPIYPLPIWVPGWLYGIGFMILSFYAMKANNRGNIGHDAHLGGAIVGFLIATALHPEFVKYEPWVFAGILFTSVLMLIYLWINPMFLPTFAFFSKGIRTRTPSPTRSKHQPENLQIDSILDKIANKGMDSLTSEEKRALSEVSGKYQRRSESKKPDSGLAI